MPVATTQRFLNHPHSLSCPICSPLNEQIFAIGQGPMPPLHPHCRCTRELIYEPEPEPQPQPEPDIIPVEPPIIVPNITIEDQQIMNLSFSRKHYDTEGPLGVPMKDSQARALDAVLKANPDAQYRRTILAKATTETSLGERSDVSWITTEALDRDNEIVRSSGWSDSHYAMNPIVTMRHDYTSAPIGRSQWRKRLRDGDMAGIKAKTIYPHKPDNQSTADWPPDTAFALLCAGLMVGKSIGFLTLQTHEPTSTEKLAHPNLQRVIDSWLLLEYACTWLPANQEAVTLAIEKHFSRDHAPIPFTAWDEIERRIQETFCIRFDIDRSLAEAYDQARGRV